MPLSVEWFDDLDAVAADAGGALDRSNQPWLYDRLAWITLTRTHVMPDAKLAILRVRDGDEAAWLFLVETGRRCAAPLASWYTLRFAPVFYGDGAARHLPALFHHAARRFDVIALHPLDAPVAPLGWRSFAQPASTNWTLDVDGRDFVTYWAARPAKMRNTVARRMASRPMTVTIHHDFDSARWAEYESVYADSWKPAEGSSSFLRALAMQEALAGTLRLGLAYDRSGGAIAAQLWLVEHGVATIHKLAHRESAKAGSPGSLLSHAMFKAAIDEDRVTRIDFGLGNEPYKADWVDTARPMWRVDAYRPVSLRGVLGITREAITRLARNARRG